jgi:hypothetical protein
MEATGRYKQVSILTPSTQFAVHKQASGGQHLVSCVAKSLLDCQHIQRRLALAEIGANVLRGSPSSMCSVEKVFC